MATRLRVLDFGTVSALRSQAIFHGLAFALKTGADPILCLSSPSTPYVCVGIHQEIAQEVDEDFCKARGLPIYRRRIGGGAVYLDHNQFFTHFIYPSESVPDYAANLYPMFIEPVVRTYRELGVEAEYRPINDIHVAGRKIGGTGAADIGEATVMAGSFMYDFDTATMAKCLKVPSEKFRDKVKATLDDYMTTMVKELETPPEREELKTLFLKHCAEWLGVTTEADEATPAELAAFDQQEKDLADPDWTYRKGRKMVEAGVKISADVHLTEAAHKAPGGLIRVRLLERAKTIADLAISGDFTCLPAGGIDALAGRLIGVTLNEAALTGAARAAIADLALDLPGVEPADFSGAAQFARSGDIMLIPDVVIRVIVHEGQNSQKMYMPESLGCYLADYELLLSQFGNLDEGSAMLMIGSAMSKQYVAGASKALAQERYVAAYELLMRANVYCGGKSGEAIADFETRYAMHMAAESLHGFIETCPPVDRVVIEGDASGQALAPLLKARLADTPVEVIAAADWPGLGIVETDFLIYSDADIFAAAQAAVPFVIRRQRRLGDILGAITAAHRDGFKLDAAALKRSLGELAA